MIRFKVTEVGTDGVFILPLPKSLMDAAGFVEGEELVVDVPGFRGVNVDYIIIHKKDDPVCQK